MSIPEYSSNPENSLKHYRKIPQYQPEWWKMNRPSTIQAFYLQSIHDYRRTLWMTVHVGYLNFMHEDRFAG